MQLDRRIARALAAVALLAALSACADGRRGDADPSPHAVLATAFENLGDRYLDPVAIDDAAFAGLERLTTLDPQLAFARRGGAVRMSYRGALIAARPEPGPHDALGWAWLSADMIEAARGASPQLKALRLDSVYDALFPGVLAGLDQFTRYESPTAARHAREAREGFGGIGITIGMDDGVTSVVAVHEGAPAEKAGLKPGDIIQAIDHQPIRGLSQEAVVGRLRGKSGSEIVLSLKRKGVEAPLEIALTRTHVVPPTVIARHDGSVLSLRITSFNQNTATSLERELRRALRDEAHPARGVVLDLRGNPGGLLDQAIEVADLFVGDGRISAAAGRHPDSNQTFDATSGQIGEKVPMVVLVNGRSASSAEIVAAALADRGRALVLGTTSYGKGTVQTIVPLPNAGELTITWSRLYSPAGRLLQGHGVVPAVCLDSDDDHSSQIVSALRAHRATVALLTALPADAADGCPRGDGETRAVDAEVARRLLAEPALYAAVIDSKRPNIAAR
jgi:carboxyl-terminal processing protease